MRFVFCKIHCPPFICFCKPSSPHIYTPGPLKLENTPHVPTKLVSVPETSDQLSDESIDIREESLDGGNPKAAEPCLKSSLRKPNSDSSSPGQELKKKVQWMDFVGKELIEIKEFECSEVEDTDNEDENRRGCICVIL